MENKENFIDEIRDQELEHYNDVRSDEFGYSPPANEWADKDNPKTPKNKQK